MVAREPVDTVSFMQRIMQCFLQRVGSLGLIPNPKLKLSFADLQCMPK